MRSVTFVATVILFLFCTRAESQHNYTPAVLKKINGVENNLISWVKKDSSNNFNIEERMKDLGINGAVVAVINNFKIEWVKAYGWADTAERKRMKANTMLQAASIGKSINAMGCLALVQNKKIDLNGDINTYLKTWKFPYDTISKGKPITLANLLSHTAGLSVHGFDGYEWNDSLPDLIQTLNGERPANNPPVRSEREPGISSEYSGGGIEISELMVEDVTGNDYSDFIRTTVFRPLQMSRTSFSTNPFDNNFATGYRADGLRMQGKYMKFIERACGGAFWTTASDLARFVIEIQLSLKGNSNKVLNERMTRLMLTPYLPNTNTAFGCFIDKKGNDSLFQHSGLNPGYCSQYYGSLEGGKGVVVLANGDNTEFHGEVVNAVATVYGWKDFCPFVMKKVISLPTDTLRKFAGRYVFDKDTTGPEIIYDRGQLHLKDPHTPVKWKMYFTSANEFFMHEAKWANQQFIFDEQGRVQGFYIVGDGYKARVNKVN